MKKNLQQHRWNVLDTNGASDMNFDLDDSEENEDYDFEWERETLATQNPQPARTIIVFFPSSLLTLFNVVDEEEPTTHCTNGTRKW